MSEVIEVQLSRVVIQEKDNEQFLHLRDVVTDRTFQIVIGFNEAAEINRKLRKIESPRPMTHDLMIRIIRSVGWMLDKVIISDLRDSTFYATLELTSDEGEQKFVDCRPSDAIALAVQTEARIFVARKVLDLVGHD